MGSKEAVPQYRSLTNESQTVYIGPRLKNGEIHHIIIPGGAEHDIKDVEFKHIDSAIKGAGEINGFSDWRAPDKAVANMQRDYKFTLGKRLDDQCFDLVMDVFRANTSSDKAPVIQGMREKVVAIDLLLRLAVDLRRLSHGQYAQAIQLTGSIGKQLTGWLKHTEPASSRQPGKHGGSTHAHAHRRRAREPDPPPALRGPGCGIARHGH